MTSIQNKGFFLDLDGTLVNNLHVMFECYSNFMKSFELPYSQSEFDFYNGTHLKETLRQIKAKYNLTKELDDLFDIYQEMLMNKYSQCSPREYVIDFLIFTKKMGWLNVVVTSAPKKLAELWIDHNLSWDLIDHVVAGDDVNNGKPDPEPYNKAAAAINADPSISFAVEDSINGIASAFGAGMKVFQITDGTTKKNPKAWRQVKSFKEISEMIDEI
jgi:HAD superfamily hydrolase (TIGR01509 family)